MATTTLRIAAFRAPPAQLDLNSSKSSKFFHISFTRSSIHVQRRVRSSFSYNSTHRPSPRRSPNYLNFASYNDSTETETKPEGTEDALESEILENPIDEVDVIDGENGVAEEATSAIFSLLRSYKEAIWSNDESTITEIEGFLKSIEDEKVDLEKKVAALSEELSYEKDRILRISADFDNFRKRTERERRSLVTNSQGEVVESLLPAIDNFERAKTQIKVENEGEERINNSYQSIYKQFAEILTSLGVESVEPVGKPFDPLVHEAIMREESSEFKEDTIIEEYRKGYKLGERLLRPSMVKVSAGPGPEVVVEPEITENADAVQTSANSSSTGAEEISEN
ncbi:protein GrpE-like [Impatiens glandulifera]|uniref:protein GrpE-like n=1 Tax=Impatiens glandulifera TaxID=253017 RepID=UPI001FB11602|nr:protein GrpE-like [Impatiens glandulifera]